MIAKPILIVHPNDKTTSFLDKVKSHLLEKFKDKIHHFNIQPNEESHQQCLVKIKSHSEKGVVIFFGHGRTTKLYGSKGDLYSNLEFVSVEAKDEHPDKYYYNDNFINEDNVDVFAGKKVFCLTCNSNDKIATYALDKGAKTFLGFGNIPTSVSEFRDDGLAMVNNDIVKFMKTELNYIIKRSLELAIVDNYNFNQLKDIIHFITNQRIVYYLRVNKTLAIRRLLTDYLYQLKMDIKILGDNKLPLIQ